MQDRPAPTPPVKDDIAVQHRPENAQSRHSALDRTGADGSKRGGTDDAGPRPDEGEIDADPVEPERAAGRASPPSPTAATPSGPGPSRAAPGEDSSLRQRLGLGPIPPGTPEAVAAKIRRVETLADWLDTKFVLPVINWPIGLDGIIGLIPGVGDTVTTGLSGYLMYEAHAAGARKRTLAKMGWNVAVDWLIGTIPLVGDVFDVAHKANAKNARLLLEELRRREAEHHAATGGGASRS